MRGGYAARVCIGSALGVSLACVAASDRGARHASTISVLYPGDEWILGPSWNMPAQFLVFLPLVAYGDDGELEGRLARSWQSNDYRTWTVHLRTDVRWHDGVPVSARDVEFTLNLLSHPSIGRITAGSFELTIADDSTYTIRYDERDVGSPLDYYNVFYPRHLLEELDPDAIGRWEFWKSPVGNGPYRYVRHVPGSMIELEANPDYFRGEPAVKRVILRFGAGAVTELLSGNVDAVAYADGSDRLKLEGDRRFRFYYSITPNRLTAVGWNLSHPFFADPNVRRALTLAIDRREVQQLVHLPAATPVFDGILTHRQLREGEIAPPLPYDPEGARRLLDQAGWRDRNGDGVLDRDGVPFRFTAITSPVQGLAESAVYVQAQLRRIGVRMEIEQLNFNAAGDRVLSGRFEAAVFSFTPFGGRITGAKYLSALGYQNAAVDTAFERARRSADPDAVDALYGQAAHELRRDLPFTVLFPLVSTSIAHRRIQGLRSHRSADGIAVGTSRAEPAWYMEHVWLEEER